ncbi:MAG: hypothetical protein QXP77_00925 [Candidatus Aenigmatarchaeota archaeon]
MYNIREKKIAEFLHTNNFPYQYEPIVNLGNKYVIPDFLVGNNIIERCGYSNLDIYWSNVRRKFKLFNKYKVWKIIVIIPPKHFDFAIKRLKGLNNLIIVKENEIEKIREILRAQGP